MDTLGLLNNHNNIVLINMDYKLIAKVHSYCITSSLTESV